MNTMQQIEEDIVEEFALFDDQMDKYEYIIDLGKKMLPLDPKFMTDDFIVKGCQSKVWLHAHKQGGVIIYEADSNTAITKGIIAILVRVLSHQKPADILANPLTFLDKINLRSHLSSQRANGLTSMIHKMKAYATAFS